MDTQKFFGIKKGTLGAKAQQESQSAARARKKNFWGEYEQFSARIFRAGPQSLSLKNPPLI